IPIAAQIRIVNAETVYFMEALHDSDYDKYGPGTILRADLTKYFIDVDHISEIDQIRGDESYKKYWTPNRRERKGVFVFNHTLQGQLMAFLMTTVLPFMQKHPSLIAIKKRLLH
ncbi:MAG: GNAT family N-acetyltransferase, partial [Clostridiales bacterium]|nr:GNAT family N-acetyltransferase [Clostridiales bacterium]